MFFYYFFCVVVFLLFLFVFVLLLLFFLHCIYYFCFVFILEKTLPSVETCLIIDRSHQNSGSIWDHSSTVAASYVWDHCRMCVLLSGNSGYLIWGSSCRTNTNIFL